MRVGSPQISTFVSRTREKRKRRSEGRPVLESLQRFPRPRLRRSPRAFPLAIAPIVCGWHFQRRFPQVSHRFSAGIRSAPARYVAHGPGYMLRIAAAGAVLAWGNKSLHIQLVGADSRAHLEGLDRMGLPRSTMATAR